MSSRNSGVIHDIGYRSYDGPREGTALQARTLYVTGLRHAWGLGRSGRSKVLPFVLLAMATLPAAILVGILALTPVGELPSSYAPYVSQVSVLVSLFAAAQAPVLFSRDLRHRSIVLYLARPLSAAAFAITRWASLATAVLVFMLVPTVLLYVGALLNGLDVTDETGDLLKALGLQVLVAMLLAGLVGLVSAWALRRGFAVVISIVLVVVANSFATLVQFIAASERLDTVGEVAGLFSPWALYNGLGEAWSAGNSPPISLSDAWPWIYLVWLVLLTAGLVLLLIRRFEKVGAR